MGTSRAKRRQEEPFTYVYITYICQRSSYREPLSNRESIGSSYREPIGAIEAILIYKDLIRRYRAYKTLGCMLNHYRESSAHICMHYHYRELFRCLKPIYACLITIRVVGCLKPIYMHFSIIKGISPFQRIIIVIHVLIYISAYIGASLIGGSTLCHY